MKIRQSGMPDEGSWATFFDPVRLLDALGCRSLHGDIVEFGCGYGLFTVQAAKSTDGKLYALDIDPEMISRTAERASVSGLSNVFPLLRDFAADGSGLPNESCAFAMLFNILHAENPTGLLAEAHRVLHRGASVGIIHWNYDAATPRGPSLDIRPTQEQCSAWATEAGFEAEPVELPGNPYHYGLRGIKR